MVHYEESWRPEDQRKNEQRSARGRKEAVGGDEEGEIRQCSGEAEVENSA